MPATWGNILLLNAQRALPTQDSDSTKIEDVLLLAASCEGTTSVLTAELAIGFAGAQPAYNGSELFLVKTRSKE